jgi:hypothetical protein
VTCIFYAPLLPLGAWRDSSIRGHLQHCGLHSGGLSMSTSSKRIRIAPASSTAWATLPGNHGELHIDANMLDDTVFGHDYKSEQSDILKWKVSSNAFYKGYSGYAAVIKKTAAPTVMTDQPMAAVVGKPQLYAVSDTTKELWDVNTPLVVKDAGADHTADVEKIDYLFGTVLFKVGYVVVGPVTITGKYMASSQICAMNKYTLHQQAAAVDETDLCIAQANGGFSQHASGLKTAGLDLSGFYRPSSGFFDLLVARAPVVVEINPDGLGLSVARGFFIPKMDKNAGKAGSLEDESVSYSLHVPDNDLLNDPFGWRHAPGATLNKAVQTVLSAWQTGALVECRYEALPPVGRQGRAVVTDASLSGGLGALNEFTVALEGSGALTTV